MNDSKVYIRTQYNKKQSSFFERFHKPYRLMLETSRFELLLDSDQQFRYKGIQCIEIIIIKSTTWPRSWFRLAADFDLVRGP